MWQEESNKTVLGQKPCALKNVRYVYIKKRSQIGAEYVLKKKRVFKIYCCWHTYLAGETHPPAGEFCK
jgi:hypothetical protein